MQRSDATEATNTTAHGNKRRRVALTAHKQEIEQWVKQGRSDEWIGSALGTTASSVQSFRSRHDISRASKHTPYNRSSPEQASSVYEGVLEHGEGESGYGLWLDPAVADDPVFQRGFSGVRDVEVRVERERIVLTPAPEDTSASEASASEAAEIDPAEPSSQLEMVFGSANVSKAAASKADAATEEGTVKFYEGDRGFGFVIRPTGHDLFFHKSEVQDGTQIQRGKEVVYRLGSSKRGPVARDVRALR